MTLGGGIDAVYHFTMSTETIEKNPRVHRQNCKIMWLKISRATLAPFSFRAGGRHIRDAGARRLNSAYHASWIGACAGGLAPRGLNGARSLWHDMSWTFACALCLSMLSESGGGGEGRGSGGQGGGSSGPLQVAPEAIGVVGASWL